MVGHCRCDGRKPIVESSTKYDVSYIVRKLYLSRVIYKRNRMNTIEIQEENSISLSEGVGTLMVGSKQSHYYASKCKVKWLQMSGWVSI